MRPLMILEQSRLFGVEQINHIVDLLSKKENVVFLSNHQTEPDPQVRLTVYLCCVLRCKSGRSEMLPFCGLFTA